MFNTAKPERSAPTNSYFPEIPPAKRKGGRHRLYTEEQRRDRNRLAQAAFRRKRSLHLQELEESVKEMRDTEKKMWSAGRVLNEFVKGMSEHMDVGNDVREALKVFEEVENVRVWKGKKRMSDGDEENGDECVLTETMTGFHRRHPSIPMTLSASSSSFSITMSPGPECDDANTGANESKRTENCSAHQADGAIHGHTNFPTLESIVPLPAATVELMSKTFGRSTLNSAGSVIPPTTLDGMQDTIEASDRPTITMNNLTTPSLSHTPARLRCGCSCGDGCDGGLFPTPTPETFTPTNYTYPTMETPTASAFYCPSISVSTSPTKCYHDNPNTMAIPIPFPTLATSITPPIDSFPSSAPNWTPSSDSSRTQPTGQPGLGILFTAAGLEPAYRYESGYPYQSQQGMGMSYSMGFVDNYGYVHNQEGERRMYPWTHVGENVGVVDRMEYEQGGKDGDWCE